tara:strand:- start:1169 stop:1897 length:729 start_codon:yes stop_codon:yes gene_type:complete
MNNYNTLFGSVRYIIKHEGIRGFYKGNMMNIMKAVPNYCMKFTLNEYYIKYLLSKNNCKQVRDLKFTKLLESGLITGVIQTTTVYPIDLIRTRIIQDKMMLGKDIGVYSCYKDIIRTGGVRALYTGFTPAILSSPIYIGLSLSYYQYLRNKDNFLSNSLIAGSISGILSQSLTYPGDTIKKQLQIDGMKTKKYQNLTHCIKSMYKSDGIGIFYRGFRINMIKSIPEMGLKFLIYEIVKSKLV